MLGIAQIPFAASDKYRLSWTSDPATTMTIGWRRTSGDAFGEDFHDDWQYTISSDSFWQFRLIQADPFSIYIRTVKFGQYDAGGNPALGYEMDDVAALTQDASVCPAWDIDSDGTITMRDARKVAGVCTLSRCARP